MTIPTGLIIAAVNLTGTISFTIPSEPANLIDNGTFDSDDGWTLGGDVTIAAGKLTYADVGTTTGTAARDTNAAITEGAFYSVAFDVSDVSGGSFTPSLGGTTGTLRTANGTYSEYIAAGATQEFLLTALGNGATISADNVVVLGPIETPLDTELVGNGGFDTSAGWTLGGSSPMTIGSGVCAATGGSGTKTATRAPEGYPITAGTYRVVFTVLNYANGNAIVQVSNHSSTTRTANGTYSEDIVVSDLSAQTITVVATTNSNLEFDNVSVKRIA